MTKNDFLQMAAIRVCAALVKCYDEKVDGIIDNEDNKRALVLNAIDIAEELYNQTAAEGWFDDKLFADEPEERVQ